MKIQLKQMFAVALVVALVFITGTPYLSSAEEATTDQQTEEVSTEPAAEPAAESTDIKETAAASEQPIVELTPVTATKSVAKNGSLELFIDEKSGQIRILNHSTGTEWLGAPQLNKKMPPTNKNFIEAPIHIRYTEGVSTTQTYPLKEKESKMAVKAIENGVRLDFDLPSISMKFAMEYRLTDTGLEVNIPFDSIKEEGRARLTSLEVLPFLEAGEETEKGSILIPDGSGALMTFKEKHPIYFENYSQYIYGGDHAFRLKVNQKILPFASIGYNPRELAALPVFGIYNEKQGILGIVTKGEYDAKINATPSGLRSISLYRTSTEFIYRNDDLIFIGNSGEIPLYQGRSIEGDRTIKYVLLEGEKANYVGMAHAYRDYLINEKGLKPIEQKEIPFQLRLLGGVLRSEIIGTTFIKMTTFEQAKKIIDQYISQGIEAIEVTYEGWSDDGVYGNQPGHFPVERKLGGRDDLEELAAYAKEKGINLYLKANYVRPFNESDEVRRTHGIRGLDREVREIFDYFYSDNFTWFRRMFYLLKPERVFDKYIVDEADEFKDTGVAGVHLKYMGDTLYSDQNPNDPLSRKETADVWVKAMDLMKNKVGNAAVDYGFGYALGHVDRIDNIPLDSSHYTYEDVAVPFYQIAVHGLVPYTAKPSNLRDDPRTGFLRALEYGAMPSYELTYAETKQLQRTMMDKLFSSYYKDWIKSSIEEYKTAAEVLNKVIDQPITNHEQLDKYLFQTTYANGMKIIVNYDSKVASAKDHLIQAYDYVVVEGEE